MLPVGAAPRPLARSMRNLRLSARKGRVSGCSEEGSCFLLSEMVVRLGREVVLGGGHAPDTYPIISRTEAFREAGASACSIREGSEFSY